MTKHNDLLQRHLSEVAPEIKKEMEWSGKIIDLIDRSLKEKGMTQRELASVIGCNETQIVRWTHGFPNYTLSTLAKLSVALGIDLISIGIEQIPVNGYTNKINSRRNYLSDEHREG